MSPAPAACATPPPVNIAAVGEDVEGEKVKSGCALHSGSRSWLGRVRFMHRWVLVVSYLQLQLRARHPHLQSQWQACGRSCVERLW